MNKLTVSSVRVRKIVSCAFCSLLISGCTIPPPAPSKPEGPSERELFILKNKQCDEQLTAKGIEGVEALFICSEKEHRNWLLNGRGYEQAWVDIVILTTKLEARKVDSGTLDFDQMDLNYQLLLEKYDQKEIEKRARIDAEMRALRESVRDTSNNGMMSCIDGTCWTY